MHDSLSVLSTLMNQRIKMKNKVEIYCVDGHEACDLAVGIFEAKGIEYTKIPVDKDMKLAVEMWARSERHTLPQIFIGSDLVGGLPDLLDLVESGELDKLVEN